MIEKKQSYKVIIFGDQYSLVSDESAESVFKTAQMVDTLMQEIASSGKISDAKKIAVLAALKLASNLNALESENNAINAHKEKLIHRIDQELFSI
jgi:cell division protein ZapA (FtsZ GTPase activity inhibitor)